MMIEVLIIEDDPMVAKFNGLYVESIPGFHIAGFAKSVEEGREFLQESIVDLILLDVYMKGETGLDLLTELRKESDPVDVILITAANDKDSVQQALRYGAVDYIIKPFTFERFQQALQQYQQQFRLMNRQEEISQEEIDRMLQSTGRNEGSALELPKGLTKMTFCRLAKQILAWDMKVFSAGELAEETGISSVSARKYLHFLADEKFIGADVTYQETGRPLTNYRLLPEKSDVLRSTLDL